MTESYKDRAACKRAFAEHVSPGKVAFYEDVGLDVVMGARSGASFSDAYSERSWFNCHCNGGVFNLGHRNPRVIAALTEALSALDIGNHHLISGHRAKLAERLAATTSGALPGVVFGVSGGEAMDLAIKTARGATGRQKVVSASGGYHGHTGLALAAGDARYREPFGPNLAGFVQVPFDDLEALEAVVDSGTAAVLLETIPATLGMPIPSPGYLEGVSVLCARHGAQLILDEVQAGLGRTGKVWGYQHHDITPDMIVTGKGLSGGIYPISATLMSAELHAFFREHPFIHISTYGGAELGCRVALCVLDMVEESGFLEHVRSLGAHFEAELGEGMPFRLRRRGLMMGLKFPMEGAGMMAAKLCYDAGIFAVYANNDTSVLQFLPPLVASFEEANAIIAGLRRAFS